MDISDITLVAMSSVIVLGSSALIIYVNCRRCKRETPQPVETVDTVETVETIIAWK